ncbi:MAG: hypothetical protein JXO72_10720 [Vicinamibacteria bacterium]|nr:hypothetical protein [Vicinamibacteria bacterium]
MRRGVDGRTYAPGELILTNGPQSAEEVQYLLRGCVAAEHDARTYGVDEIILKKRLSEDEHARHGLEDQMAAVEERFKSRIEPLLPTRSNNRRTFASVIERARNRRREIGAFLRGLDLGRTEVSHMDSYGEASLQSLLQWAARLETLSEIEEPEQADYTHFHRGLDQLDNTTEALIVDVEMTLRRLRDKLK